MSLKKKIILGFLTSSVIIAVLVIFSFISAELLKETFSLSGKDPAIRDLEDLNTEMTALRKDGEEIESFQAVLLHQPLNTLLSRCHQEAADAFIMGAKKRSWIRKLFGDNVVEKVISQAPCPVFVVSA